MRLRRSSADEPGIRRRRSGRGFRYVGPDGAALTSDDLERVRQLAIPPAWEDVWICTAANGHLQAVGRDAAGRQQYLYHQDWRNRRDLAKFERMSRFAQALPRARRRAAHDLRSPEPTLRRAQACAFRLLDVALVRVGGEQYARTSGARGVATLLRRDAALEGTTLSLDFVGKSAVRQSIEVDDAALCSALRPLLERPRGRGSRLLAHRSDDGAWRQLTSNEVNDYVHDVVGEEFSAKDFRTWHATLTAAAVLSRGDAPNSERERRALEKEAYAAAAERLGNTPAVARSSYVDPRVVELARSGRLPAPSSERRLRELMSDLG